jgi:FKBP-type peptidyl-prolyl cis-trans isomerase
MKTTLPLLALLVLAACAAPDKAGAPKTASAEAQPACQATPKEIVVKDIAPGEGRPLIPRASVMVHYTGWLYDGCKADFKGNMFDTSHKGNPPVPMGVVVGGGRVIEGFNEALVGMKERGAKRLVIIPPQKAYGEKGFQNIIPPNSALVFELQTVGIGYYPPQ